MTLGFVDCSIDNGMSLKKVSAEYDRIYAEAQALLDKYKPCQGPNGALCILGSFCCSHCPHLGPTGCTVKALWCKLWLCETAKERTPKELLIQLDELRLQFRKLPYSTFTFGRYSKQQYLCSLKDIRRSRQNSKKNKLAAS